MNDTMIFKSRNIKKADAAKDIDLINQYSLKELKPEDVYCFSVVLCDNEIDRDLERFTDEGLKSLAALFVGKTGIKNHDWDTDNQVSRIYRAEVEDTAQKTSYGAPYKRLMGSAYMLNSEANKNLIDSIEGGIVKEVSIGFTCKQRTCSICGERLYFSWDTWREKCKNDHVKGEQYDGTLCVGILDDPKDAFEFSFVAVPSQRGAGVAKGVKPGTSIHELFLKMTADQLAEYPEANAAVIRHLQTAMLSADERKERADIIKSVEKYRKS